jgi:hypothetical protein
MVRVAPAAEAVIAAPVVGQRHRAGAGDRRRRRVAASANCSQPTT